MKTLFYTTLLAFFILASTSSCVKRKTEPIADTPVIVYDETDTPERNEPDPREELDGLGMGGDVRKDRQNVKVVNTGDIQKLKKYSVVVATLSQQRGVTALKGFFDRDGINYFVVKNAQNRYYFVVHSSDSEDEALRARATFLIENTVNKSREDIWQQYFIQLTDTFILEKE